MRIGVELQKHAADVWQFTSGSAFIWYQSETCWPGTSRGAIPFSRRAARLPFAIAASWLWEIDSG